MKYGFLVIMMSLIGVVSPGRSRSDLEEWRSRGLPSQIKRGVVVELYDLKETSGGDTQVRIRVHNLSEGRIGSLWIKLWFWKDEGVYVEELELIEEDRGQEMSRGREKFFPGKGSYYRLKKVEYKQIKRVDLEISRILSKRS